MSIRPIDFNGMLQNTNEVSQNSIHEQNQTVVQQDYVADQNINEAEISLTQIKEQDDIENSVDSEGEGNGAGYGAKRKKKKKTKEKVPDGTVKVKGGHGSFDVTV